MKKVILFSALAALSFAANAEQKPGNGWEGTNAECTNVGTMIFKGKTGPVNHLLAMTTNGYSMSLVAFGVTSGTLECDTSRPVASIRPFVDKNMERLAADVARGQGESLTALASLLEVSSADQAAFNAQLQNEFDAIFSADDITSDKVISNIVAALSQNADLATYVS